MKPTRVGDRVVLCLRYRGSRNGMSVLGVLAYHDGERCCPSVRALCEGTGLSRKAVFAALAELRRCGVIERDGAETTIHYDLVPVADPCGLGDRADRFRASEKVPTLGTVPTNSGGPHAGDGGGPHAGDSLSPLCSRARVEPEVEPERRTGRGTGRDPRPLSAAGSPATPDEHDSPTGGSPVGDPPTPAPLEASRALVAAPSDSSEQPPPSSAAPPALVADARKVAPSPVWVEETPDGFLIHIGSWSFLSADRPTRLDPMGLAIWLWDRVHRRVFDAEYPWVFSGQNHDGSKLKRWLAAVKAVHERTDGRKKVQTWREDPGPAMQALAHAIYAYQKHLKAGGVYGVDVATTKNFDANLSRWLRTDPTRPVRAASKTQAGRATADELAEFLN